MPRVQLIPLLDYPFSTELTVRTTDLNYGGHLGNDRMLALLQEARVAMLDDHGWSELDCGGASLILGDAAIIFQQEAFAGDRLKMALGMSEPSACGFRIFYQVRRLDDNRPVALAETGMICFDYENRKIVTLPAPVREVCEELQTPYTDSEADSS